MNNIQIVIARIFLGHIFLLGGLGKIGGYAGTQAYMESVGVPGILLPLVILLEIGGGLAIVLGAFSRWASYGLAAFSIVSAILFHNNFGDQIQMIMFMKNIAIAGGLLLLVSNGAGSFSVDRFLTREAK